MAKILIARLGAMGDILHALPAVTSIRAALPTATLGWLVEDRWTELLTARGPKPSPEILSPQKPVVNLIHTVDTKAWRQRFFHHGTLKEMRGARRRVRDVHYDLVLDFQGAIKSAVLARGSGAAQIAGFRDPREPAARFFYSRKFPRVGEHVIEQNHALAAQALQPYLDGKELKLLPPSLPCDPAAEAWAQTETARLGIASFALLNPGAGWEGKQWPPERFGAVAQGLAKHNIKSLVNAPLGEEALARTVVEAGGGHAFAVEAGIGQLIALTRRARLFVGGDTGPMHLAAALGVPTVALFGPTDPARTGPFGEKAIALRHPESETTFSHHRKPDAGLLQINAEEVIAAARHLLGGGHG
jgi:lipopolysaccharide heptosyltransferase I